MTDILALAGKTLPPSDWFTIDQPRINAFADATLDHQYIHIDPERAAQTPFGGTIAHGFLLLSLMPKLLSEQQVLPDNVQMAINYGFDKIRFISPVKVGSTVRLCASIQSIEQRSPGKYLQRLAVTLEIKGQEKPALIGEWLNLFVCQ